MNVTLRIKDGHEELEKEFVKKAAEQGMIQLKGHRYIIHWLFEEMIPRQTSKSKVDTFDLWITQLAQA